MAVCNKTGSIAIYNSNKNVFLSPYSDGPIQFHTTPEGNMNVEMLMVLIPGLSWVLFALGGTQISPTIGGQKWIRRFLLPGLWCLTAFFYTTWWQAPLATLPAMLFYSLGYGDSTPWWQKILIGCSYGLIGVAVGISWWNLVTPIMFSLLFFLSNWKPTEKMFSWKICEGSFGLFIGIQLAYTLMGGGIIW